MNKRLNYRVTEQTEQRIKTVLELRHHHERSGFDVFINELLDHTCSDTITADNLFHFLGTNPEQEAYILSTVNKTGIEDLVREMRIGLLARLKTLNSGKKRLSMIDLEDPDSRKRRMGAGEKALEILVARLMAENDAAPENADKVFLSGGLLLVVGQVGKNTIAQFQRKYRDFLNTHHAKHGWYDAKLGQKHNQFTSRKYRALIEQYGMKASA